MTRPYGTNARGASLLEAIVAAGVLATMVSGTLPLLLLAITGVAQGRGDLIAAELAGQRLAQLQTLVHVRTPNGPIVDRETQPRPDGFQGGGAGLTPTGARPLQVAVPGGSEWLDERGAWLADGSAAVPVGAAYQRRWGVLPAGSDGCLRLWVEVRPLLRPAGAPASAASVHCPWGVAS